MRKSLFPVFVILAALFTSYTAWAEELIEEVKRHATLGDAQAQEALGVMYYLGEGVPKDYQQAFEWFKKAAVQGNSEAQFNLGVMCAKGQGVRQDYHQAFEWYIMAADKGNARAQSNLGRCTR